MYQELIKTSILKYLEHALSSISIEFRQNFLSNLNFLFSFQLETPRLAHVIARGNSYILNRKPFSTSYSGASSPIGSDSSSISSISDEIVLGENLDEIKQKLDELRYDSGYQNAIIFEVVRVLFKDAISGFSQEVEKTIFSRQFKASLQDIQLKKTSPNLRRSTSFTAIPTY